MEPNQRLHGSSSTFSLILTAMQHVTYNSSCTLCFSHSLSCLPLSLCLWLSLPPSLARSFSWFCAIVLHYEAVASFVKISPLYIVNVNLLLLLLSYKVAYFYATGNIKQYKQFIIV